MRATSPYSIGALTGKGMHDACRMRGLTGAGGKAIALAALVFCLAGEAARADAGPGAGDEEDAPPTRLDHGVDHRDSVRWAESGAAW